MAEQHTFEYWQRLAADLKPDGQAWINGRDKSLHAFDKYTELKAAWIKLD